METISVSYKSATENLDDQLSEIAERQGGDSPSSGCSLSADPERDIQFEFESEANARAFEQEVKEQLPQVKIWNN